ncbi:MAG: hypothetical protein LW701_11995 [Fluviicola sp.]|jgi:hypothetical protein|nr:hypothetical protein [Fluviicola sp.]
MYKVLNKYQPYRADGLNYYLEASKSGYSATQKHSMSRFLEILGMVINIKSIYENQL